MNFHSVSDAERALDTLNYSGIKAWMVPELACGPMLTILDGLRRYAAMAACQVASLCSRSLLENLCLRHAFHLCRAVLAASCGVKGGGGVLELFFG